MQTPQNIYVNKAVSANKKPSNPKLFYDLTAFLETKLKQLWITVSNCCNPTSLTINTLNSNYQITTGYNIVTTVDNSGTYGVVLPHAVAGKASINIHNSDVSGSLTTPVVVTVGTGYTSIPVITVVPTSGGINGAVKANMKILTSSIATNGINFITSDVGTVYTLAGGGSVTTTSATITPNTLQLLSLNNIPVSAGTGYVPNDTIALNITGGTQSAAPIISVISTKVVSATIASPGTGGTNGTQTVTGTTGVGTKFQASVTVSGGSITAVLSITVSGNYTTNPTVIASEPVTGASLSGATLNVVMGVNTINTTPTSVGSITNTSAGAFNQTAGGTTSGSGATFNGGIFGVLTYTLSNAGIFTTLPSTPMTSSGGTGTGLTITPTTYGLGTLTITNAGEDYLTAPTLSFSGGGGTSAAGTVSTTLAANLTVFVQPNEYFNNTINGSVVIPSNKTGIFLVSSLNNWVTFSIS